MVKSSYSFDTRYSKPAMQFEEFRREFTNIEDYTRLADTDTSHGFRATCEGYDIGPLKLAVFESDAYSLGPSSNGGYRWGQDFWLMTFRICGHAAFEEEGKQVFCEPGGVELRKLIRPRHGEIAQNRTIYLYLPREAFDGLEQVLDRMAMTPMPEFGFPKFLYSYMAALYDVLPVATEREHERIAETTMSMIRSYISSWVNMQSAEASAVAARFEVAQRLIRSHLLSDDLTPEFLSAQMNVSRRQLYKMFEAVGGVQRHIRSQRLQACHDAILRADRSKAIWVIAEEFGFLDAASFSRQFRAEFGFNPSALRQHPAAQVNPSRFTIWLQDKTGEALTVLPRRVA